MSPTKHEITSQDLSALLADIQKGLRAPVYLFYGDEFLYKSEYKKVLAALVPADKLAFNYELLDGSAASPEEIIGRMNTFAFLPGPKVVAVQGFCGFYSKKNAGQILQKAKQAYEKQEQKKAAGLFMDALRAAGLTLDDVKEGNLQELHAALEDMGDTNTAEGWFGSVLAYCMENDMAVTGSGGDDALLQEAVDAGFPAENHLILLADVIDKRKKLFKTIKEKGVIVDCSIATGGKTAEKRQQAAFLKSHMNQVLKKEGKTALPSVFEGLYEKTGAELRVFHQELEKLITFVGQRPTIGPDDVEQTARKSKQDPVYELSNALAEKDLGKTLSLIQSLLESGFHPLPILSTMVNQIRKLILVKDLSDNIFQGRPVGVMEYRAFQQKVLPKIQKVEGNPVARELHPYVLYMSLGYASNYSMDELVEAMKTCLWADLQMKTSGHESHLVLEKVVMDICRS